MPLYEATFTVEGFGWAAFRADNEAEAREIAEEYWNKTDTEFTFVELNEIKTVDED